MTGVASADDAATIMTTTAVTSDYSQSSAAAVSTNMLSNNDLKTLDHDDNHALIEIESNNSKPITQWAIDPVQSISGQNLIQGISAANSQIAVAQQQVTDASVIANSAANRTPGVDSIAALAKVVSSANRHIAELSNDARSLGYKASVVATSFDNINQARSSAAAQMVQNHNAGNDSAASSYAEILSSATSASYQLSDNLKTMVSQAASLGRMATNVANEGMSAASEAAYLASYVAIDPIAPIQSNHSFEVQISNTIKHITIADSGVRSSAQQAASAAETAISVAQLVQDSRNADRATQSTAFSAASTASSAAWVVYRYTQSADMAISDAHSAANRAMEASRLASVANENVTHALANGDKYLADSLENVAQSLAADASSAADFLTQVESAMWQYQSDAYEVAGYGRKAANTAISVLLHRTPVTPSNPVATMADHLSFASSTASLAFQNASSALALADSLAFSIVNNSAIDIAAKDYTREMQSQAHQAFFAASTASINARSHAANAYHLMSQADQVNQIVSAAVNLTQTARSMGLNTTYFEQAARSVASHTANLANLANQETSKAISEAHKASAAAQVTSNFAHNIDNLTDIRALNSAFAKSIVTLSDGTVAVGL